MLPPVPLFDSPAPPLASRDPPGAPKKAPLPSLDQLLDHLFLLLVTDRVREFPYRGEKCVLLVGVVGEGDEEGTRTHRVPGELFEVAAAICARLKRQPVDMVVAHRQVATLRMTVMFHQWQ